MIIVDTSAWIEYFRNGTASVVSSIESSLSGNLIAIGDLIYCEVMQGIKIKKERDYVGALLLSLPRYNMVGFECAEKAAENYRSLRSNGITVRKTIDVIIGTFCAENRFQLIHNDRDFDLMAPCIGLEIFSLKATR
jgi:predicted nucleic acid-binding protein